MRRSPTERVDKREKLADHDLESLAARLAEQTGERLDRARRAAAKTLRHAFAESTCSEDVWDDDSLSRAGIGRWIRPFVLQMSPRIELAVAEREASIDGTTRLLLRAGDGALVESVIIPAEAGRDRPRTTLCVSSQVGCSRGCTFCETGTHGLTRQLSAAEIVDQYRIARRICEGADRPTDRRQGTDLSSTSSLPISNVVFMGMGEPLDNLKAVTRAISLLCAQQAFAFAAKRITVSTAGRADKLNAFFTTTRAELGISLNAAVDAQRDQIMPINRDFNLQQLRSALLEALPRGRRVLIQYALFANFNDALEDADALADYVQPIPCRVNVIPANPGPTAALVAPSDSRVEAFVGRLQCRGVMALLRRPRGQDVCGACGQLSGRRRATMLTGSSVAAWS